MTNAPMAKCHRQTIETECALNCACRHGLRECPAEPVDCLQGLGVTGDGVNAERRRSEIKRAFPLTALDRSMSLWQGEARGRLQYLKWRLH